MKKIYKITFITLFCALLGLGFFSNMKSILQLVRSKHATLYSWQKVSSSIESQIKKQTRGRNKLIDLYGAFLRTLQKQMIGNFEFIKDEWGIMQRCNKAVDTQPFENSVADLKKYLGTTNTPLIFLQMPDKLDKVKLTSAIHFSEQKNPELLRSLSEMGIDVVDVDAFIADISAEERKRLFISRTDMHFPTYTEFYAARILTEHLIKKYNIYFPNFSVVFDKANWNIASYQFLGNTARSAGRFFVEPDQFEVYSPKFKTDLTLFDENERRMRIGDFRKAAMNGYEERGNINLYTYWVTDYGQWPKPYYRYQNNLNNASPRILILADSIFMRGTAFLSLLCSDLTTIDLRYLKNTPYIEYALNRERYDAVIICASDPDFLRRAFTVTTTLPDLKERHRQTSEGWIGTSGICIDTCNSIPVYNTSSFQVNGGTPMTELTGWAADFAVRKPLKALYLQVGSQIIQCNYGLRRTSVSDHFKNFNLTNTGFSVKFPTSYFKNGEIKDIQFIQIGTDGTYRYQPVTYDISYLSSKF